MREPPDLPLPLLAMAMRILYQLWPMEVPFSGSSFNSEISVCSSFLSDGNFFTSRLAWRSKTDMVLTLKLIEKIFGVAGL